jgi:hypothetical protein
MRIVRAMMDASRKRASHQGGSSREALRINFESDHQSKESSAADDEISEWPRNLQLI